MSAISMDEAVAKLMALAENKRANRSQPVSASIGELVPTPFRMSDFPEPSAEWLAADRALKVFANELGGLERMVAVYDEAVERHGYRAVMGVSASWSGCHGWWH